MPTAACGKPVIGYGEGGILETVRPFPVGKPTGLFFYQPTPQSLIEAVDLFERNRDRFDPGEIRTNALLFDQKNFREKIESFVREKYQVFHSIPGRGESDC